MKRLYCLSTGEGISYEAIGELSLGLTAGQLAVLQCDRYQEVARIQKVCPTEPFDDPASVEEQFHQRNKGRHIAGQHLPYILRVATDADLAKVKENSRRLDEVHQRTVERIQAHHLSMKLIHEHYTLDRRMLIFQFTSEGRVDFRELIRDLSTLFHCRVELRQVGVRDETSIIGGLGCCGRPFCCSTFLHSIVSVNVKTAKQQGLSLNPQNISGCCGRLKCCLQFEADYYHAPPPNRKPGHPRPDYPENDTDSAPPSAAPPRARKDQRPATPAKSFRSEPAPAQKRPNASPPSAS
ncbi:MAG: hypothetical protein IKS83_09725 [Victivallales bacterium]|nr:hypothetical protein [Victivallales bacterium]